MNQCVEETMCSLEPESKSQISDLDEIEEDKILDDIHDIEGKFMWLALAAGDVDDEGSRFTSCIKLTSLSYFYCEILELGEATSLQLPNVASFASLLLEALI